MSKSWVVTGVAGLLWTSSFGLLAAQVGADVGHQLAAKSRAAVVVSLHSPVGTSGNQKARIRRLQGDVLKRAGLANAKRFSTVAGFAVTLDSSQLDALKRDARVRRIDLDEPGRGGLAVSVPLVGAGDLQQLGIDGSGTTVAVFDTGIQSSHPDLSDALINEACFLDFDGVIDGIGRCPGGGDRQFDAGAGEDDQGHGTLVAGIITANGVLAGPGMAPAANVFSVKVLDSEGAAGTFSRFSELIAAMEFILEQHPEVDVINMSLGTDQLFTGVCDSTTSFNQLGSQVVDQLNARGTMVVSISQNEGSTDSISSPACLSGVIAVASSTKTDDFDTRYNSAATVDLVAPGAVITTTASPDTVRTASGTSFAAPHVSGCVALLIQSGAASTLEEVRSVLLDSPVQITDPRNGLTFPRLDCSKAVPTFAISAGISGTWFETTTPGQGLLISVLSESRMVVFWFTYDPDGRPLWLLGDGSYDGARAELDVLFDPDGPVFGPGFDPDLFQAQPWGRFVIEFSSCSEGVFQWNSDLPEYASGQQLISRLSGTLDLPCP